MARRRDSEHSGVLNIDKPVGLTSHDVVNRVRRLFDTRRVGHAGTLDPAATGVLLVCVGPATRLAEFLVASTKEYEATIRFGVETDTYDSDGEVVETRDASGLDPQAVREAFAAFVGEIEQMPPIFSAVKRNGVPAYKLARKGKPVELEARRVRIDEIELLSFEAPDARVRVRCQAGTYMRSLAHDVGRVLETGAHLASLARTASGSWRLESAVTLEDISDAIDQGRVADVLHPPEAALRDLPGVTLDEDDTRRISHGQIVHLRCEPGSKTLCAFDAGHRLVAILDHAHGRRWKPRKVFLEPES